MHSYLEAKFTIVIAMHQLENYLEMEGFEREKYALKSTGKLL